MSAMEPTRPELESQVLAAVAARGTAALLEAQEVRGLLQGDRLLVFDAALSLARRGEVGPSEIAPGEIEAELVRNGASQDRAAEVRITFETAIATFPEAAHLGAAGRAAGLLADLLAAENERHGDEQMNTSGLPEALLPAARLLDSEFPPVEYAVEPYFPRAEVTELVGAHGIFKSTAALGACLSVACGRGWGTP